MNDLTSDFSPVTKDMISWGGPGGHVGTVDYGSRNQVVFFHLQSVRNGAKSVEAGRDIFEDKIFVRVAPPGERLNVIDRPATQADARTWPMQWAQFQQNRPQESEGTPISMLFPANPSIADTLRGYGVHTVEQCAELSSDAIHSIMGGQDYVNKARKFMEMAARGVSHHKFEKELADRDSQIRVLQQQLAMMQGTIEQLQQAAMTGGVPMANLRVAGGQLRPTYPPVPTPIAPAFDPQTAQISATHPTRDIADKRKRSRVRQAS